MGRSAVDQEPIERLLAIRDVSGLDHRVGDVRPTYRRAVADVHQDLFLGKWQAESRQPVQDRRQPHRPAGPDLGQLGVQPRMGLVGPVAEQMDALPTPPGRHLDPADHLDTVLGSGGDRLVQSVVGVVIGQRHDIQPGLLRLRDQLGRCVRPVGDDRVGMEVDAHALHPICRLVSVGDGYSELRS